MHPGIFCLIWYGRITNCCSSIKNSIILSLQKWIGPAPLHYRVLADGRVVQSIMQIPHSLLESSYEYTDNPPLLQQLAAVSRPRRTSWIALRVGEHDLSDWVQSLRWVGTAEPSLLSLVTLWSTIQYQVFERGTRVLGTKNTAEEIDIPYV